jgi:hypothetical protein
MFHRHLCQVPIHYEGQLAPQVHSFRAGSFDVYCSYLFKNLLSNERQGIRATYVQSASHSLLLVSHFLNSKHMLHIGQGESALFLSLSFLDTLFS